MMSAYAIVPLVFGIVLSYLWLIHHFWLRRVFREDHKPAVRTRIVILGGGFGGLHSSLHFEKIFATDPAIEVTLVSRENFALFTPMLHEVAAGDLRRGSVFDQRLEGEGFAIIDPAKLTMHGRLPHVMALLGICHRTIHTVHRPQNKAFLLRKPLPPDPASFGARFRVARVAQGHTQTEMACKFGVSLSTVKFWEQGRTQPNPSVRAQVEAFLNNARLANSEISPTRPLAVCGVGNLQSRP